VSGPEESEPVALYAILQRRLGGSITGSETIDMALIELTGTFCKSCIPDMLCHAIPSTRCCRIAPFDSGNPCSHVRAQTWHWQGGSEGGMTSTLRGASQSRRHRRRRRCPFEAMLPDRRHDGSDSGFGCLGLESRTRGYLSNIQYTYGIRDSIGLVSFVCWPPDF